jgi:hypothetical protein
MEEQLISFETAKLAKEKGFELESKPYSRLVREKDVYYWNNPKFGQIPPNLSDEFHIAPTQSLLQKWLREVHGIYVQPFYHPNTISTCEIKAELEIIRVFAQDGITKSITPPSIKGKEFDSYEEALEIGLQAALKLIIIK